jgi:3-dehydroquinate synthase
VRGVTTVQVLLDDRSYPIQIRPGSLREVGPALQSEFDSLRIVIVTSPRVAKAHLATVSSGLESLKLPFDCLTVPDGERAKTLRTASRLYDRLLELGCDRRTVLVGLGGGAVGDLTGFVASTFLRGVPLVQIPTTLLSQIDASVGGKTAVNHPRGKNLIGTFYQPRLVLIDPDVLATLRKRELRCGMAELIKGAAIWDAAFFGWLEENIDSMMRLETDPLTEAIARACSIKAEVVGLDEREAGLRALLNFGHTLAHAVENVVGYRKVLHGEAVSMGMVFASRMSEARGLVAEGVADRIAALLGRVGLPTEPPDWSRDREAYLRALSVDKKVRGEKVAFVVLREIGRAELLRLSPDEILEGAP